MGPKITGTPGQTPGAADPAVDDEATDAKPAKKAAAKRDDSGAETVTRDLSKKPKASDERPMITLKTPPIEAPNEEEALALANIKGRAVFCPSGRVCPSVSHERRAA